MALFSDILLTVDYDRTLTAPDSTIPERNIEAIRYFIENGGAFTINTGRSVPMYEPLRDLVPVNAPLLLYNGSAAYDRQSRELSQCQLIDLDLWQTVAEIEAEFPDVTVEIQGKSAHYHAGSHPKWEDFSGTNHCAYEIVERGADLGEFLKFAVLGKFYGNTVASFFGGPAEDRRRMDEVEQWLRRRYGEKVEVFRAADRIIDVHAKGISKIKAARMLQAKLGRKILVCAGDADNDIPMLEGADFAYCPADGVVADRFETVCNCAEGAVATVIYEKIPGILNLDLDKRG